MSTRRGETVRKRPQKYQNTRTYKNDLHDKTPLTRTLNNLNIANVCEKCKKVLEWRIKYKKFKPRKAPGTCTKCLDKNVKHAYHMMCKPCSSKLKVCPKCGKQEELVEPEITAEEQMKLDHEMEVMLQSLPERKKRTFLRYLEKSKGGRKKRKDSTEEGGDPAQGGSKDEDREDDSRKGTKDLLAFLQQLKISSKTGDDFDDLDDLDGDTDSDDFDDENDDSGDEDDEDEDEGEDEDKSNKKGKK